MDKIIKTSETNQTKEILLQLNKVLLSMNLVLVIALFIIKIVKNTKFKAIHFALLLSSILEVVAVFGFDDGE